MDQVTLDFGVLTFTSNYVITEINSGVDIGLEEMDLIIKELHNHFPTQPYGYISNRQQDYSVIPSQSKRIFDITNLKCAAFVMTRHVSFRSFELERQFYQIPLQTFTSLELAEQWMSVQMKNNIYEASEVS